MRGYFMTSARRVFGDRTWWWRSLVLAAILAVPVVGAYVAIGYYLVLMREAAWGLDRGLPRFGEYREVMRRAWDGFVVSLVWGFVLAVPLLVLTVAWVAAHTPPVAAGSSPAQIPWWLLAIFSLLAGALSVLTNMALLRTAVYLKPSAGLTVKGILGLIKRDPAGFRAVTAIALGVFLITSLLNAPAAYARYFVPLSPVASIALRYGWMLPAGVISLPLHLVAYTAYGLWAKDTNPSSWPPLQDPAPSQPLEVEALAQVPDRNDNADGPFSMGD